MTNSIIWVVASGTLLAVQTYRPEFFLSFCVGALLGVPYFLQASVKDKKSQKRVFQKLPLLLGIGFFTLHRQFNFKVYFVVAVILVILSIVTIYFKVDMTGRRASTLKQ